MGNTLFIEAEIKQEILVMRPLGTFNVYQMPIIRGIIESHISVTDKPQIVLSLKSVRFVDIALVKQLNQWVIAAQAKGGDIKICETTHPVKVTLQTIDVDPPFEVYDTEQDALATFDNSSAYFALAI